MRFQHLAISALALACLSSGALAAQDYSPGKVLVKFKRGMEHTSWGAHALIGARLRQNIRQIGWQVVALPPAMSVEDAVTFYDGLATVADVEPAYIFRKAHTPNDPRFSQQYAPQRTFCELAWDLNLGSDQTVIAIIDSGVDYNHQDLAGKVILGGDYVTGDGDPMDEDSHGTHVAGIAAAKTNNAVGIAGIGYNCKILAIRVLGPGGGDPDWIAQGILEAANKGAKVINLSLGGYFDSSVVNDAITVALSKGSVVLAAAGNDGITLPLYPAGNPDTIAVAATNRQDQRAGFSNYGSDWVDVAAPGEGILSTIPGNQYAEFDGTSMACPVAAGVMGLIVSYSGPGTSVADLRNALESSCDFVGNFVAFGRVNAFKALNRVVKPVIVDFPVVGITPYQGVNPTGTVSHVAASDDARYTITSVGMPRIGSVGGVQADLAVDLSTGQVISSELKIEASAATAVTGMVWVYNNAANRWHQLKSFPTTGTDKMHTIPLPKNLSDFVANGTMKLIVRGIRPERISRQSYNFNIDMIAAKVSFKPDN